jgi:hypothetical protein
MSTYIRSTNRQCDCGGLVIGHMCPDCGRYLSEARRRGSRALVSDGEGAVFLGVVGALYAACTYIAAEHGAGWPIGLVGVVIVLGLGAFLRRNLD